MKAKIYLISVLSVFFIAQTVVSGGKSAVTLWRVIFNNLQACLADPSADEKFVEVDIFGKLIAAGNPNPSLISPNIDAGVGAIFDSSEETNPNGNIRLVASIYKSAAGGGLNLANGNVIDPLG